MTVIRAGGPTLEFKVHFSNGDKGRRRLKRGARPTPPSVKPGRVPRISRLMALAIRYDDLIRQGIVKDYADLARLGGVSRARISQIMDLLNLASELQEAILFLPRTTKGCDSIRERNVRPIAAIPLWSRHREMWEKLTAERMI
ncbi:MAG: hypothetical protein KJ970_11055 [Candidatus Eisenbacteria bacterium]|uniref:Uncharacterized protein n=1 Tax=Eiseniibacteriota bacterium TaxID=2212470 RepID=A0A948RXK7_UNCEI|nr:hypothetical protein [Candidatus Eisenbacteria bacterium]MBU1950834.1 hypothetical protein [Candidatus Eisenbacteria bacterium]MBU2691454.1 hypothetical protein [Candidatus Eisenbacteria bacterium]